MMASSVEMFNDFLVKHDKIVNKDTGMMRRLFAPFFGESIIFGDGFDENYSHRRKTLASAFFKNKLLKMMQSIKSVTLK